MKKIVVVLFWLGLLIQFPFEPASAAEPFEGGDAQHILSRLQAMGHEYHPASEWSNVIDQIHGVIADAEEAGDYDRMVEVTVVLAEVYSGMLGLHQRALDVLEDLKAYLSGRTPRSMSRLYVQMAEVYTRMGDDASIQRLIEEFKRSPYYDPEGYQDSGLEHPDDPLIIRRPHGRGQNSLTVTRMKESLKKARLAPGKPFPSFSGLDHHLREIRIPHRKARVLLVDFWLRDWVAWRRDLPQLVQAFQTFHDKGFDVIGFNLDPTFPDLDEFLRDHGMVWPQVIGDRKLASQCGLAGEAGNFLIAADGKVIARDLRGSELIAAIRKALKSESAFSAMTK